MSLALTIAGGVFQLIGLSFLLAEFAALRVHAFGGIAWWTRLNHSLQATRAKLRKRRDVHASVELAGLARPRSTGSVTVTVRPGPLADDATDAVRIAWIEEHVKRLVTDVEKLQADASRDRAALPTQAEQHVQKLRYELDAADERRKAQLRWSLWRQRVGTVCVLLGVVLATVGDVA
jgi:hypothetical protein